MAVLAMPEYRSVVMACSFERLVATKEILEIDCCIGLSSFAACVVASCDGTGVPNAAVSGGTDYRWILCDPPEIVARAVLVSVTPKVGPKG